ncbi:MAG: 6-phosphofructokinase [Lachnospiraceae bacterium]|nr:6-phosphofructokinase [Lachnospiraceae bacterium]
MKNVIVGQSGGPSSVINSSLAGVYCRAKAMGADKVYGMRNGIQGFLQESLVDLDTVLGSNELVKLLRKTPAAFLGSCRFKLPDPEKAPAVFEKIFELLNKYEIKAFIYIGGNDSMDTIRKLSDYGQSIGSGICFVGAPKTIDNDLAEVDHTPGYGSAAKFIAAMTKEAIRDEMVYSTNKTIYIMEIMGRNAGWLTAASALARGEDCDGPDLIYLPEVPFDLAAFRKKVDDLLDVKNNLMIAVSEGIHDANGTYICEYVSTEKLVDAFGHKQMGGTASYLCSYCEVEFGCKTRAIEFSTLQRCAAHFASQTDVNEAFQSGDKAVEAALSGRTGLMATLLRANDEPYVCEIGLADVHHISNVERLVPLEWITEDGSQISDDFIRYALPLIQGESQPVIENGLPKHLVLK